MRKRSSPSAPPEDLKAPYVRLLTDETTPMKVVVVEDKNEPSLGIFAAMIFLATLLGTVIGLAADLGELIETTDRVRAIFDPPTTVCVAGSGTILGEGLGLANTWKADFESSHADVRLTIDAIGSVDGVDRAADGGCVHVLAMSEAMTDAHYQSLTEAGIEIDCAAEIGYDIISFVTNVNNPMVRDVRDLNDSEDTRPRRRPITDREMRSILLGNITDWREVSNWPNNLNSEPRPITIFYRPGSGTTEHVLNQIAGFSTSEDGPNTPPNANYVECGTQPGRDENADCLNATLATPGSLYWVSVSWMRTQPPDYLSVLSILDGDEVSVNPLTENVDLERYPTHLARPLFLYVLDNGDTDTAANTLARNFIDYVRGIQGQQIVDDHRFYNHFSRPVDIRVNFPEPVFDIPESGPRTICKDA